MARRHLLDAAPLPRRLHGSLAGAVVALLGVASAAPAIAAEAEPISIHRLELARHRDEPRPPRVIPGPPGPPASKPVRAVYGYYPFWLSDLSAIRWSALTHLAWFAVELDAGGQVVATHGWPDAEVVDAAHAAGVRVDVTFTLFGSADIEALCTSPASRAAAIDAMVTLLEQGGADGVSIDFEFVGADAREAFVALVSELRGELDARGHAGAQISVAGPAVDWQGALDLPALLGAADWFFVMGYGYFGSGSSHAGPTGMLRVTADWAPYQSRSMTRTIAAYTSLIPAAMRRQILWGVPYYGREWTTASGAMGAATITNEGAVTYSAARSDLEGGLAARMWHDGVKNPWYRWQDGSTWHQVYYDDAESLAAKYELALAQDLGGVGIWALNYDAPHPELWDLLQTTFREEPATPEGHRLNPIPIDALPFHDARDTTVGASHYFNDYACAPDTPEFGREWVYRLDVCQPGAIRASVPAYPDRDLDLHLLTAPDPSACIGRAHTDLEVAVEPGRYLLVVDTYVDMPVELEGAYELDVDFVPAEGSEGCTPPLICEAGTCICPDPGQIACGGACVDTSRDPANCGGCGRVCAAGEACVSSQCAPTADAGPSPGEPGPPEARRGGGPDGGCGCRAAEPPAGGWGALVLGAALLARRRRRRAARA